MQPNCDACPLKGGTFVPPSGPDKTEIAFLGEAPGWTEIREKKPFVGKSGQLLRAAITACGHDPEDIYFTNTCKCKPKQGAPPAKAIECCSVTLRDEFREHGVKYVAALGLTALAGLGIKAGKMSEEHGHTRKWHDDILVMPIIHPAGALYKPARWPEIAEDIEAFLAGGEQFWRFISEPLFKGYTVTRAIEDVLRFLWWLGDQPFVYFDLETSDLKVHGTRILCISFSCGPNHAVVIPEEIFNSPQVGRAFCSVVNNSPLKWGGHNAQYDVIRTFTHKWHARPYISEDTMVQHYCLDERTTGHGLKELAMKLLRVPDWEADIKQWVKNPETDSYATVPKEILYGYNARDTVYGYRLHQLLRPKVAAESDLEKLYTELMIPATNALVDLTVHGTKVDLTRIYDIRDMAEDALVDDEYVMQKLLGDTSFNPRSPKQVSNWLYEKYGAPPFSKAKPVPLDEQEDALAVPYGRSDKTTAVDQLERIAYWKYPGAEFAALMMQYRKNHQLVYTYLQNFVPESDGRIHPGYLLWSAVTGRLSSSRPNVLNMTRKGPLRSVIVPEEGNILLSVDYRQAELRVLGALAKSERLIQLFRDGFDPHNYVGEEVYGKSYNPSEHRVGIKSVNFGVAYGRGRQSIADALSCTLQEAGRVQTMVLQLLNVDPWMQEQYRLAKTQQYVSTPTGRRRRFPLILDSNWNRIKRMAVNSPVQGTSSDLCLLSMIEVNKKIPGFGGAVLYPIHDALLVEVPEENKIECARMIVREMSTVPERVFEPDTFYPAVEITEGHTYAKEDMKVLVLDNYD
jgi:DNA polymerase-1